MVHKLMDIEVRHLCLEYYSLFMEVFLWIFFGSFHIFVDFVSGLVPKSKKFDPKHHMELRKDIKVV